MRILAIESSCDETAATLLEEKGDAWKIMRAVVATQIDIHAQYGGVVPEVAARSHVTTVIPVLAKTLGSVRPDAIAVTAGPGLVTSLLVGVETARALAYAWDVPVIPINHIEGHIYANWLERTDIAFPALVLIVSGGHTELILMKRHGSYSLIGQTRDDAAGEAFDKGAKILDLGYPGGPAIALHAHDGSPDAFSFPRPMIDADNADFSFSGLKTALLYRVRDLKESSTFSKKMIPDLCASYQEAIVDVLVSKTIAAAKKHGIQSVLLGGGVAANTRLRTRLADECARALPESTFFSPQPKNCTDNASMIAVAGLFHARRKDWVTWKKLDVRPQWKVTHR